MASLDSLLKSGKWNEEKKVQEKPKPKPKTKPRAKPKCPVQHRKPKGARKSSEVEPGSLEALYDQVGKEVFRNRTQRKLFQSELAKEAGISLLSLVYIERGKRNLQLKTLYQLAKAMDLKVEIKFVPKEEEGKTE